MLKKGFTLIELMISLLIASVVLISLATMFSSVIIHSKSQLNAAKLRDSLQFTLDIMTNDIRRAGYWADAHTDVGTGANNNPFMEAATDVFISANNSCILLSYDADHSGNLPSINPTTDDERYGFRLINNTIQARPPGATFSCTAATDNWENITDVNVVSITNLGFIPDFKTIDINGSSQLILRNIDITIAGHLTNDSTIAGSITRRVRVRNSKFIP